MTSKKNKKNKTAKAVETVEVIETIETAETIEATEEIEATEAVEVTETAETTEVVETAETIQETTQEVVSEEVTTQEATASTLTAEQILESEQAFLDYVEANHAEISSEVAKNHPKVTTHTAIAQLTQSGGSETIAVIPKNDEYTFWYVVNPKDEILNAIAHLNSMIVKNAGMFVLKAVLNEDKIEFIPIVAPEVKQKTAARTVNRDTATKNLQFEYWQKYAEICDKLGLGDLQINPAHQHYQDIKTGKGGSQLFITLNTQQNLAAVEFRNTNDTDKKAYNKLLQSAADIENELKGIELEWCEIPGKKSSKIKTTIAMNDVNNREEWEATIKKQIKIAGKFVAVIPKYL